MCCTELHKAYVLINSIHDFLVCIDANFESQNLAFVTHKTVIRGSEHHEFVTNNCPTRCNNEQSIYLFIARSLYMFRVSSHPSLRVHKTVIRGSVHHDIITNNCPTRCNNEHSIYLLQGHSTCFGCRRTHHQEYIKL